LGLVDTIGLYVPAARRDQAKLPQLAVCLIYEVLYIDVYIRYFALIDADRINSNLHARYKRFRLPKIDVVMETAGLLVG
jgi:hypothetical protein